LRKRICACALLFAFAFSWGVKGQAISLSAASAVLIDGVTGRILYENNAHEPRLIASITKIMTAVTALEHCDLNREYTVIADDWAEGSSMYLKPGEVLTLEQLLYGLLLASGNDAALAVARCVSGSVEPFVSLMNDTARRLSMENTSFANPNGLDAENHRSSAYDMAKLTAYAMKNETFRRIVSTKSITIGERTLTNHNKLLALYDGCIGVKTGYTKAAGRTLVSAAERNGQLLIAVTLRDGNDWQDHMALFDYGFAEYPRTCLISAGEQVGSAAVRGSFLLAVPVVASRSFACALGEREKAEVRYDYYKSVTAPIPAGAVIGKAVFLIDGEEAGQIELVCGANVSAHMRREE